MALTIKSILLARWPHSARRAAPAGRPSPARGVDCLCRLEILWCVSNSSCTLAAQEAWLGLRRAPDTSGRHHLLPRARRRWGAESAGAFDAFELLSRSGRQVVERKKPHKNSVTSKSSLEHTAGSGPRTSATVITLIHRQNTNTVSDTTNQSTIPCHPPCRSQARPGASCRTAQAF